MHFSQISHCCVGLMNIVHPLKKATKIHSLLAPVLSRESQTAVGFPPIACVCLVFVHFCPNKNAKYEKQKMERER